MKRVTDERSSRLDSLHQLSADGGQLHLAHPRTGDGRAGRPRLLPAFRGRRRHAGATSSRSSRPPGTCATSCPTWRWRPGATWSRSPGVPTGPAGTRSSCASAATAATRFAERGGGLLDTQRGRHRRTRGGRRCGRQARDGGLDGPRQGPGPRAQQSRRGPYVRRGPDHRPDGPVHRLPGAAHGRARRPRGVHGAVVHAAWSLAPKGRCQASSVGDPQLGRPWPDLRAVTHHHRSAQLRLAGAGRQGPHGDGHRCSRRTGASSCPALPTTARAGTTDS